MGMRLLIHVLPTFVFGLTDDLALLGHQVTGWGLLSQFTPLRYFPNFSVIKILVTFGISRSYQADVAAAELRRHLSNMDVIWRIFRIFACKSENFPNGEISERGFSNPHPWRVKNRRPSVWQLIIPISGIHIIAVPSRVEAIVGQMDVAKRQWRFKLFLYSLISRYNRRSGIRSHITVCTMKHNNKNILFLLMNRKQLWKIWCGVSWEFTVFSMSFHDSSNIRPGSFITQGNHKYQNKKSSRQCEIIVLIVDINTVLANARF